jgi:hypothetical protein
MDLKQYDNLFKYVKLIPDEAVANLWISFIEDCKDAATSWWDKTPGVKERINEVLRKTRKN